MSSAEHPQRLQPEHTVSVDDVRQLMGASTPHFALQIRDRLGKLVAGLAQDDPARILAERERERLARLGLEGETRGEGEDGLHTLASVSPHAAPAE
jgi:hypothetical protein